jgi:hypothetical protein
VRAASHHPLTDPGQLHGAAGVHAVAARAVLARHLAHAGVDAHVRERPREPPRRALEARVDAGARLVVRHRVPDLHRPVVEDRGAPAREPQRRLEAVPARCPHRLLVALRDGVSLRERHRGAGQGDPERLGQLPRGHAQHQRAGDGRVEGGIGAEGVLQEPEAGPQ